MSWSVDVPLYLLCMKRQQAVEKRQGSLHLSPLAFKREVERVDLAPGFHLCLYHLAFCDPFTSHSPTVPTASTSSPYLRQSLSTLPPYFTWLSTPFQTPPPHPFIYHLSVEAGIAAFLLSRPRLTSTF
ncbi:unnamed protein product [Pleuronectes platessa]|uniref:Uncharacterized protein n=1 Tax=Pleuronectes platessa TaxID=8262 RepID=A0A9N7Y3R1_PLEPL|nr:unnamed protein product [Pleuronectes platessa]